MNPSWKDYIEHNHDCLMEFSYRKLASFLQKYNPQINDILIKITNTNIINNGTTFKNYEIVNLGHYCQIIDSRGVQVYCSTGRIKQFGCLFYRFYYTYSVFSVNQICVSEEGTFTTGKRIVHAKYSSPLYKKLDELDYISPIEDINYDENKRVKVYGNWYDENGNEFLESCIPTINNISSTQVVKETQKKKKPHYYALKEAMVGDRILYDTKQCIVIEKKTVRGSLRLVVKYDDGTIDNLKNDWDRYIVL